MPATFELGKVNPWITLVQAKAQAVRQNTTLSQHEKNGLLAVLGVAFYSANHWKEVLQAEDNPWHQGLSARSGNLTTILGPVLRADLAGAISGFGRVVVYTPASTTFGPGGDVVNYVGNVGVGAMISSGGAAIAAWLNL